MDFSLECSQLSKVLKTFSTLFIKEKTELTRKSSTNPKPHNQNQKPITVLNNRNKMPVTASHTCNKFSSIRIKKGKVKLILINPIQLTLEQHDLNCTGLLRCGFFFLINIQQHAISPGFESADSQQWFQFMVGNPQMWKTDSAH